MSKLIEKFREKHKNVSSSKLVDEYYDLLSRIQECKKAKEFKKMLRYCQKSISLLEPLIEQTKKEFGVFDIRSIPAIEIGSIFWAIYGDEAQLLNLKEIIEFFPELEPWKKTIEKAFLMKDLAQRIYQYVKDNEGCLQKELKKALGVNEGRLISNVVYYMELVGKLERKKMGNTYALFCKIPPIDGSNTALSN